MGRPLIDMIGRRYGRLTVISRIPSTTSKGCVHWLCRCDCGTETTPTGADLRGGTSKSCGCLRPSLISAANSTHGMRSTPTYSSWRSMHKRCTDPSRKWHHGLGMVVCEEWSEFGVFFADMGVRPDGKTLDRKNGKLGYFKENCRWATNTEQQRNKSNNRFIDYEGNRLTVSEWSERCGLSGAVIIYRLNKGWDTQRVLTQPLDARKSRHLIARGIVV